MGPNLNVTIEEPNKEKNYQIVRFSGEFDKAGHTEVRGHLDDCIENFQSKSLIFDFAALKFINSEGIGYLMEIHTHLVQRDKQLVVIGLNSHVKDVFETIGIAEIIPIYSDLDDFLNR